MNGGGGYFGSFFAGFLHLCGAALLLAGFCLLILLIIECLFGAKPMDLSPDRFAGYWPALVLVVVIFVFGGGVVFMVMCYMWAMSARDKYANYSVPEMILGVLFANFN